MCGFFSRQSILLSSGGPIKRHQTSGPLGFLGVQGFGMASRTNWTLYIVRCPYVSQITLPFHTTWGGGSSFSQIKIATVILKLFLL